MSAAEPSSTDAGAAEQLYYLKLEAGTRFGLTPEILDEYSAIVSALPDESILVIGIDDPYIEPAYLPHAVEFVETACAHMRTIAHVRKASNGAAFIALSCPELYMTPDATIESARSWPHPGGGWWHGDSNREMFAVSARASKVGGRPQLVLDCVLDRLLGCTFEIDSSGGVIWGYEGEMANELCQAKRDLQLSAEDCVEARIAHGITATVSELATLLGGDKLLSVTYVAGAVPQRWRGLVESADRIVPDAWAEWHRLEAALRKSDDPTATTLFEEFQVETDVLVYWATVIGPYGKYYLLPEGEEIYLRSFVAIMESVNKHPSDLTPEDLELLRERGFTIPPPSGAPSELSTTGGGEEKHYESRVSPVSGPRAHNGPIDSSSRWTTSAKETRHDHHPRHRPGEEKGSDPFFESQDGTGMLCKGLPRRGSFAGEVAPIDVELARCPAHRCSWRSVGYGVWASIRAGGTPAPPHVR